MVDVRLKWTASATQRHSGSSSCGINSFVTGQRPIESGGLPGGRIQADMSLEESGTVLEAEKNRGDHDQWVVGTQQGVKHTQYDSTVQGHGL